jgi:hypothetical protein
MNQFVFVQDTLVLLLFALTSLLALIGNGFVYLVSLKSRNNIFSQSHKHKSLSLSSIYLLNLAIADGLSGLTIPIQWTFCSKRFLENFLFSSYICLLSKSIEILGQNASIWTVCIIAFNRYDRVKNPLQYRQFISCQILFPLKIKYFSINYIHQIRIFCLTCFFYIVPLFINTILCILTISHRSIVGVQKFRTFDQSRTRSIRLLMVIVIVFALSHLPVHFIHVRDFFISSSKISSQANKCNHSTLYLLFYWLCISSSFHNPIKYSWFNRKYRILIFNCYRSIFRCSRQEQ